MEVRLEPLDQRLQVPLLRAEAFTSGPAGTLQGQGLQPCGCLKGQETPHLGLITDCQGPHGVQRPGGAHRPTGEALNSHAPGLKGFASLRDCTHGFLYWLWISSRTTGPKRLKRCHWSPTPFRARMESIDSLVRIPGWSFLAP